MEVQSQCLDRISALPQDTIEQILTLMPIRDALRTSILSKKWRYSWTTIPKIVFDIDLVESFGDGQLDKYKFFNVIFHVLVLHMAPILEFSLSVNTKFCREVDQIILHLSRRNNIKKFIFKTLQTNNYLLPRSFFTLQGLEHLDLTLCEFGLPSMIKGFSALKSLCFSDVSITNKMLFKFLTNCPLLEDFTWTTNYNKELQVNECEFVELFKCLPSVQVLKIMKLYIKHVAAGSMPPHKLPISLPHLRVLVLGVCFLELSTVLCVISSSPNLEKIKVEMCRNHDMWCPKQTFKTLLDDQDYMGLNFDHLKEIEITNFNSRALEIEFVKLIMAKSPVLKKARIELRSEVSVNKDIKMFQDLVNMPFPRALPAASFTIERPKIK